MQARTDRFRIKQLEHTQTQASSTSGSCIAWLGRRQLKPGFYVLRRGMLMQWEGMNPERTQKAAGSALVEWGAGNSR